MAAFVKSTTAEQLSGVKPAESVLVVSGAYTATASAEFGLGPEYTVVEAVAVATAKAATPSVVFAIQGYNPATDAWETLIAGTALTDAGTSAIQVNPNTPSVANVSAQRVVRRRMRVLATHDDADALTYSITVFAS